MMREKIKTLWNRNKPIIMCIIFSILETILFFIMGLIPTSDNYCSIKTYQTYLGDYIVGIATTWYVIFTYFILKANVVMRNLQFNPLLRIEWDQSDDLDQNQLNGYDYLSEYFRNLLGQTNIDYENKRYAKLKISNTKDIDLGILSIMLNVNCLNEPERNRKLELAINNPDISRNNIFMVTILDLAYVPEAVSLQLTLESFIYTSKISKEQISDYGGNKSHEFRGTFCIPELTLTPMQDNTK